MQTRRRQILLDGDTAKLGDYLPAGKSLVTTIARRTADPVAPVGKTIGMRIADAIRPISVSKSILAPQLPVDPIIRAQMARLAPADKAPAMLDRMKMIGTELVKLPRAVEMLPGSDKFVPNTAMDSLQAIAAKVKDKLGSSIPLGVGEISSMLSRAKVPILAAAGIAAVAAMVFAGYKLYKRFSRPAVSNASAASAGIPALAIARDEAANKPSTLAQLAPTANTTTANTVSAPTGYPADDYAVLNQQDIGALAREIVARKGYPSSEIVPTADRIRRIAQAASSPQEFISRVAEL